MSTVTASRATEARKRPPDRRLQIEDAAAALFADRGFAGTGVGEIAAAVGITGGAIYRHFAGKDQLLATLVLDTVREFIAVSRIESGPADARLERLTSRTVDLTLSRSARVATYLRERPRVHRTLKSTLRRYERQLLGAWRDVIADANPSLTAAEILVRQAAVNGVLTTLAERRHTVSRPRLHALATDGLVAVVMSPPSPASGGDDREAATWTPPRSRRLEIVDAAATLIRRNGYSGVGIDQIGEAAGIAGPTVYGTFDSKAEILAEIYDRVIGSLDAGTEAALEESSSAEEALGGMVRAYVEVAFNHADLVAVASREGQQLDAKDRRRIARRRAEQRHLWADVLTEVRPDLNEAEARTLVSACFLLVQRVALVPTDERPPLPAVVDLAVAFLLADPRITPMETR